MTLPAKKENLYLDSNLIAQNILALMHTKNINEVSLAEALGISVMTIRRLLSGETSDPRISTLKLFADYFEVGINSILEKTDDWRGVSFKNKPFFVPIFDWNIPSQLITKKLTLDLSNWKDWYPVVNNHSIQLDNDVFALKTKRSMQPRYPEGTILIINPKISPIDGDIVLVMFKDTEDLSLRELLIDIPRWILQPIIGGGETIFFDEQHYTIIGVVVLSLFQRH